MSMIHRVMLSGLLTATLVLGACAHTEPFEYQNTNDSKPGRGVFTGDDGVWTIYRQEMPSEATTPSAEKSETASGAAAPSDQKDQDASGRADSE
jgi:hypothetical protein